MARIEREPPFAPVQALITQHPAQPMHVDLEAAVCAVAFGFRPQQLGDLRVLDVAPAQRDQSPKQRKRASRRALAHREPRALALERETSERANAHYPRPSFETDRRCRWLQLAPAYQPACEFHVDSEDERAVETPRHENAAPPWEIDQSTLAHAPQRFAKQARFLLRFAALRRDIRSRERRKYPKRSGMHPGGQVLDEFEMGLGFRAAPGLDQSLRQHPAGAPFRNCGTATDLDAAAEHFQCPPR